MEDGNILFQYNHPAVNVVLSDIATEHWSEIDRNHQRASGNGAGPSGMRSKGAGSRNSIGRSPSMEREERASKPDSRPEQMFAVIPRRSSSKDA